MMHSIRFSIVAKLLALTLMLGCVLPGCGGGKGGPVTVPASGKVTYKNAPVSGAHVSFLGDGTIQAAMAVTDANGEFVLTTSTAGDGAVAGTHQVTVMKTVGAVASKPAGKMSMEDAAKASKEAQAGPPPLVHLVPEKYSKADTSGLSYTVKSGEKNRFEIVLVD